MERLLVGDIGGSNCRLGLVVDGVLEAVHRWPTARTSGLRGAVEHYSALLCEQGEDASWQAAAVAVAGPVSRERAALTNVPGWEAHLEDLRSPGLLLNDLAAVAWAVGELSPADLVTLQGAAPQPDAPAVVVGVGTGLGVSFRIGGRVIPGEGGHADFAPASARQDRLLAWLRAQRSGSSQIIVEHVLSGPGLGRLLRYAATQVRPRPEVQAALAAPDGPPLQEVLTAWRGRCRACELAVDLFIEALASEIAGLGLRTLSCGGIYLCGGVSQLLGTELADGRLRAVLADPCRDMSSLRQSLPVLLVTHPDPALLGAAAAARQLVVD